MLPSRWDLSVLSLHRVISELTDAFDRQTLLADMQAVVDRCTEPEDGVSAAHPIAFSILSDLCASIPDMVDGLREELHLPQLPRAPREYPEAHLSLDWALGPDPARLAREAAERKKREAYGIPSPDAAAANRAPPQEPWSNDRVAAEEEYAGKIHSDVSNAFSAAISKFEAVCSVPEARRSFPARNGLFFPAEMTKKEKEEEKAQEREREKAEALAEENERKLAEEAAALAAK